MLNIGTSIDQMNRPVGFKQKSRFIYSCGKFIQSIKEKD